MPNDAEAIREWYMNSWKQALCGILGWSEERVERWAHHWHYCFLSGYDPWFTHDSPESYIASFFVPDSIARTMNGLQLMHLEARLGIAIRSGGREAVDEILGEYGESVDTAVEELGEDRELY